MVLFFLMLIYCTEAFGQIAYLKRSDWRIDSNNKADCLNKLYLMSDEQPPALRSRDALINNILQKLKNSDRRDWLLDLNNQVTANPVLQDTAVGRAGDPRICVCVCPTCKYWMDKWNRKWVVSFDRRHSQRAWNVDKYSWLYTRARSECYICPGLNTPGEKHTAHNCSVCTDWEPQETPEIYDCRDCSGIFPEGKSWDKLKKSKNKEKQEALDDQSSSSSSSQASSSSEQIDKSVKDEMDAISSSSDLSSSVQESSSSEEDTKRLKRKGKKHYRPLEPRSRGKNMRQAKKHYSDRNNKRARNALRVKKSDNYQK